MVIVANLSNKNTSQVTVSSIVEESVPAQTQETLIAETDSEIESQVTSEVETEIETETESETVSTTPTESKDEFIASCQQIPYKDLLRNPDDYIGQRIVITAKKYSRLFRAVGWIIMNITEFKQTMTVMIGIWMTNTSCMIIA